MNKNYRWIILIVAVLLIWNASTSIPKEAVADIEGKQCNLDTDCPCLGTYNLTEEITAYGIGVGSCEANTCDMSLCVDLQPVGEWARDNPLAWIKANIVLSVGILLLLLMAMFWPKR